MKYAVFAAILVILSVFPVYAQDSVREEVKCVFHGSTTEQKCYTDDGKFSCAGTDTCVAVVSGERGAKLTWKSSCGSYAYTSIDGQSEYAEFKCVSETHTEIAKTQCAQVITPASDGVNCKEFPTPCDVPDGWKRVESCKTTHETISIPVETFNTECPPYINVDIGNDAFSGQVIGYLGSYYPDLREFVTSCDWDEKSLREKLSAILDSDSGWKKSCEKMSSHASECRRRKSEACGRFEGAIEKCESAFADCRARSEKAQETEELIKQKMDDLRRRYEEKQKQGSVCGNKICDYGENYKNCHSDCPIECEAVKCDDGSYVKGTYTDNGCKYEACAPITTRTEACEKSETYPDGTIVKCYTSSTGACQCDKYPPNAAETSTTQTTATTQTTLIQETTTTQLTTTTTQLTTTTTIPLTTTTEPTATTLTTTSSTPTGQITGMQTADSMIRSGIQQGISQGISQGIGQGISQGIHQGIYQGFGSGGFGGYEGEGGFGSDYQYFEKTPKCYAEEKQCQRLREMNDKCRNFVDKCAVNCERFDDIASRCKEFMGDKEALLDQLLTAGKRICKLKDYKLKISDEKLAEGEIVPVIIVTKPKLSEKQEAAISAFAQKHELIHESSEYSIYRALMNPEEIERARELDFVSSIKVDRIIRAVRKEFEDKSVEKGRIAAIEGVKGLVDETTASVLGEKQDEILDASEKALVIENKENEKGIGFALLKFLGFKAKEEEAEASDLNDHQKSIDEAASSLEKIANGEDNIEAKAVLLEQAKQLKEKAKSLKALSEKKRNSARGLLSFLFG